MKAFTDTANQLKDVTGRASMSLQQTIAAIEAELKVGLVLYLVLCL